MTEGAAGLAIPSPSAAESALYASAPGSFQGLSAASLRAALPSLLPAHVLESFGGPQNIQISRQGHLFVIQSPTGTNSPYVFSIILNERTASNGERILIIENIKMENHDPALSPNNPGQQYPGFGGLEVFLAGIDAYAEQCGYAKQELTPGSNGSENPADNLAALYADYGFTMNSDLTMTRVSGSHPVAASESASASPIADDPYDQVEISDDVASSAPAPAAYTGPAVTVTPSDSPVVDALVADLTADHSGVVIDYTTESTLITQGAENHYVYIVLEGELQVQIGTQNVESATGMVGEMSVLLGIAPTATVVARPGAQVLRIPAENFKAYLRSHPEALQHVQNLIFARFAENMETFFSDPQSIENLFPDGEMPALGTEERPTSEEIIPASEILVAFETGGTVGLANLISCHMIAQALNGHPEGLQHWMRICQGNATAADALYIFQMMENGQLHLHPTRSLPVNNPSLPIDLVRLGGRRLAESGFNWNNVQAKLAKDARLLELLHQSGYQHIRDVFVDANSSDPAARAKAIAALEVLTTYSPDEGQGSLVEYLGTGNFISSLYRTPEDISLVAQSVAMSQYADGARYVELRFSPDQGGMTIEQVVAAQIAGLQAAQAACPGLTARAIVIFDTTMTEEQAQQQADALLKFAQENPQLAQYLVGIDTAGPEVSTTGQTGGVTLKPETAVLLGPEMAAGSGVHFFDISKFATAFTALRQGFSALGLDIQLTTHAGENFATLEQGFDNISRAIELGAVRIGHGIIVGLDIRAYIEALPTNAEGLHVDALGNPYTEERIQVLEARQDALKEEIADRGIVIEACPASNTHTSPITNSSHPLGTFMESGIPVSISNDNSITDSTSGTRQLIAIAQAQGFTFAQVSQLLAGSAYYGMGNLSDHRATAAEPAGMSSHAFLGVESFTHNIPDLVKSLLPASLTTGSAVSFLSADGQVLGADSFGSYLVGRFTGFTGSEVTVTLETSEITDPNLRELAHGQAYLHLIPVRDGNDAITGYLAVGSNDGNLIENNPQFTAIVDSLGNSMALAHYIDSHMAVSGARSMSAYYTDTQLRLSNNLRLTEVYVNLSLHDINNTHGHTAGDALLADAYQQIEAYAEEMGVRVTIYQDGANFIIVLDDQLTDHKLAEFMQGVHTRIAAITSLTTSDGRTIENLSIDPNIAAQKYDSAIDNHTGQPLTAVEMRLAGSQIIGAINAGWMQDFTIMRLDAKSIRRSTLAHRVQDQTQIQHHSANVLWPTQWEAIKQQVAVELEAAGIEATDQDIEQIARERFIEADSGLFNHAAFQYLGAHGSYTAVAFFDGNRFGAFAREFGLVGSQMVDAVIARISNLAETVFKSHGIILFRHGPRSEEFYLAGDVSPEVMQAALADFQAALAHEFKFSLTVAELQSSEAGLHYLEQHPEIDTSDATTPVTIDIVALERAGVTGLTITAATMAIPSGMTFEQASQMAVAVGEAVKNANLERVGLSVQVQPDGSIVLPANLSTQYGAELNLIGRINPELGAMLAVYLANKTPEQIAEMGIDVADLRELREYLETIQNGGPSIETREGWNKAKSLLSDLGIAAGSDTTSGLYQDFMAKMMFMRIESRFGTEAARLIANRVDLRGTDRSSFMALLRGINRAYQGHPAGLEALAGFGFTSQEIMNIRVAVAKAELRQLEIALTKPTISQNRYSDHTETLAWLQAPAQQDLLTELTGTDYAAAVAQVQMLEAQLESLHQETLAAAAETAAVETPAPATAIPGAPATDIPTILREVFHLNDEQIAAVTEVMSAAGLTNEQRLEQLTAKLNVLNVDVQAFFQQVQARIAQAIVAGSQTNMAVQATLIDNVLSGGSSFSRELIEEIWQDAATGSIGQALGVGTYAGQFLLEYAVEPEFVTALAQGKFRLFGNMLGTGLAATGAGGLTAGLYNAFMRWLGAPEMNIDLGITDVSIDNLAVGVGAAVGYSALLARLSARGAQLVSRILGAPLIALQLNALLMDGLTRLGAYDEGKMNLAIAAAQSEYPNLFNVLSVVSKEHAALLICYFSNAYGRFCESLGESMAQVEIAARELKQALSLILLEYVRSNPIFLHPELYGTTPNYQIVDQQVYDPQFYASLEQSFVTIMQAARQDMQNLGVVLDGPSTLESLLGISNASDPIAGSSMEGADIVDLLANPQTYQNPVQVAYMMFVGLESNSISPEMKEALIAMNIMTEEGEPNFENPDVGWGQQKFWEEHAQAQGALITLIDAAHEMHTASLVHAAQAVQGGVDMMHAGGVTGVGLYIDQEWLNILLNLDSFLFNFNLNNGQLLTYLLGENAAQIEALSDQQLEIYQALDAIARLLSGEEVDTNDPLVRKGLALLLVLAAQPTPELHEIEENYQIYQTQQ